MDQLIISKNLILSGITQLTLYDNSLVTKNDLKIFESYPYIINNHKNLTLYCYDLGLQIDTPLANIIEYSSPVIILLLYVLKYFYYDKNNRLNTIQIWTIIMIIFHYLKRVFESIFVHIQINSMEFKMFLIISLNSFSGKLFKG